MSGADCAPAASIADAYARVSTIQLNQGRDLLQAAAFRPGENVIDIGCGSGELSIAISHVVGTSGRVLGVDLDSSRIDTARSRQQKLVQNLDQLRQDRQHDRAPDRLASQSALMPTVEFAVGSSSHLLKAASNSQCSFQKGSVDVIFANHVLHWIADKVRFFQQCHQLLRIGGRIVLQSPSHDVKILTRLTKIAPAPTCKSITRAIHIAGSEKLLKAATAARFDISQSTVEHVVYSHQFSDVRALYEWMEASTHGQWRAADVDADSLRHFEEREFDAMFGRTMEVRVCRLTLVRPSEDRSNQIAASLLPVPPPIFFEKRLMGAQLLEQKRATTHEPSRRDHWADLENQLFPS